MAEALVHVCRPRAEARKAWRAVCCDCGKEALFAGVFYPWYGWSITCLACGRNWQDGEWMPLPFSRTARADSVRAARKAYRRAGEQISPAADEVTKSTRTCAPRRVRLL